MTKSEEAKRGIDAGLYSLFMLMVFILTIPVLAGLSPVWMLAFPAAIAIIATSGRVRTVKAIEARRREELEGPTS